MSDYFDSYPNDYDEEGDASPFIDWSGWSDEPLTVDPYIEAEQDILDTLGIEDYDSILLDPTTLEPDELRGNRFSSLQEAITYLFDAGILRFSGVVMQEGEIMPAVKKGSP